MREILFRGQTRKYGEKVRMGDGQKLPGRWVYGGVLQGVGVHSIIYGGEKENDPSVGLDKWVVYTDTLGQFTGLTDKNGKKIFEGDILQAKVYETEIEDSPVWGKNKIRTGNKIDAVWTVEYKNFNASCGYFIYGKDRRFHRLLTCSVIFNNECEVIGNIHDNPELLEVSHD